MEEVIILSSLAASAPVAKKLLEKGMSQDLPKGTEAKITFSETVKAVRNNIRKKIR